MKSENSLAIVVGKGVIGLATAHRLAAEGYNVALVHDNQRAPTSQAAAANLALKSQQYGRDDHFQLKILGSACFEDWLKELQMPVRFKRGLGREVFKSSQKADEHQVRMMQPENELNKRLLPQQDLIRINETTFCYGNEAWVHAQDLLTALEVACKRLGVSFVDKKVTSKEHINAIFADFDFGYSNNAKVMHSSREKKSSLKSLSNQSKGQSKVFLCGGYNTPEMLLNLKLQPKNSEDRSKLLKPRLSLGSTFENPDATLGSFGLLPEEALIEIHNDHFAPVYSGDDKGVFLSSTTLRLNNQNIILDNGMNVLKDLNQKFLASAGLVGSHWNLKTGVRLGFGHEEILHCVLESSDEEAAKIESKDSIWYLISGAHKSGFLYAAAMRQILKALDVF